MFFATAFLALLSIKTIVCIPLNGTTTTSILRGWLPLQNNQVYTDSQTLNDVCAMRKYAMNVGYTDF